MWLTVIGWISYNTVIVLIMSLKETNHFSTRDRDGGPELDLYENLFWQIFTHGYQLTHHPLEIFILRKYSAAYHNVKTGNLNGVQLHIK